MTQVLPFADERVNRASARLPPVAIAVALVDLV
jgi:hypothetical protein